MARLKLSSFIIIIIIQHRLWPGYSGRTSRDIHRCASDVIVDVISHVIVAAFARALCATSCAVVVFRAVHLAGRDVRPVPAVRRQPERPVPAAGRALPAGILPHRMPGVVGRRRRAAAADPSALLAATRRCWPGRRRCRRGRGDALGETLAEVARIHDNVDSPVCCRVCSVVSWR